jgi:hypothetical protein
MNIFDKYYKVYQGNSGGFSKFHTEVINMPRDQFADTGLEKVRMLAGYLLLTEGRISYAGCSYKDTMRIIKTELTSGNYPKYRDTTLENKYFNYSNLDKHYETEGRMFRHLMSLCDFFGFVESISRDKKVYSYDKCNEYYLSEPKILMPIARNNLIMLDVGKNNFMKSLSGIMVDDKTMYRPAYAIIRYISEMKRPVTKFELSILLGRIDELKHEKEILDRAFAIGTILPKLEDQQINFFFEHMKWIDKNGHRFLYARSQEPYFKFNNFLLFMSSFELIAYDTVTETYSLTQYSKEILQDDISYLIADLEKLLQIIDNELTDNNELNELILTQRNPELLALAKEDDLFVEKMNFRSLNHPIVDTNGKRKRNHLIAELAKILADYKCQYANRHIFKMPNGRYYCESHHIIEFSRENGPDITLNLLALGPEAHTLIHRACNEDVENAYLQLQKNGALDIKRFRDMASVYKCLTQDHINVLTNKKIITTIEKTELEQLIANT